MATTRIVPMHIGKGRTIAVSFKARTDYAKNPEKTDGGELISAYQCDPVTVDVEFFISKNHYHDITGRAQPRENDVIAYQLRQSFIPGEITPELANKIGYDMAMRWTKGQYQFIVCTHIDKEHIHNHIIYCASAIDGERKFRNFWGSSFAIRKLSDQICVENNLSIIENPRHGNHSYGKWLGDNRRVSFHDKLKASIDEVLAGEPKDLADFLQGMSAAGYEIKQGKNIAFRGPGQQRFCRCSSLGEEYYAGKITERIQKGDYAAKERPERTTKQAVNLLVDIQAKMKAGKGAGYERWARVFNLKQMAQTLNYLSENGLLEYNQLEKKAHDVTTCFNDLSGTVKKTEARMNDIAALEGQIVNYAKTRDVYVAYRKAGYNKKFYAEHETEILLHKASKDAFAVLNMKKLPTIKTLKTEYAELLAQKKSAYQEYAAIKKEMRDVVTAKANVDRIFGQDAVQPKKQEHGRT